MTRTPRPRSLSGRRGLRATAAAPPAAPRAPLRRREDDHGAVLGTPGALPPEVARQSQREMDRLRRLPAGAPEAAQVRAYLQWLWALPWDAMVTEDADLRAVERELDHEQLGMARPKQRILEYLAVRQLKPDLPGPALCLVGPPGTGKSSLGAAVAKALGRPFVRLAVSGTSGAADIVGAERTAPGAQPGRIVRALRESGARNPVLMIDGVDRLTGDAGTSVVEELLELLDPESATRFTDHYIGLPLDLSHAVLLLCANQLELVPDALSERMEVIEVPGYSEDEKIEIARRFLLPRQLADHGLAARDLVLPEETLRTMVRHYTLEAGVRGLSRQLATVCRKLARARVTGTARRLTVQPVDLFDHLGPPVHLPESVGQADEVGVAAGLAWTAAGGEILVVEALRMPGSGRIVLTGHLGEVMRESVQAAHSYVRSRADLLGIPESAFSDSDIHIHFPAAGVPKDGPSAGITIGLVIASVLSDRPIRHDIAMTGEVSLRGKVLVVGGMREKALAAYRGDYRALIFPTANLKDLADIPEDVRRHLELLPVDGMDEVFLHALSPIVLSPGPVDPLALESAAAPPASAAAEAPAGRRDVPGLAED
jgi:ATP-dependent Lon protease